MPGFSKHKSILGVLIILGNIVSYSQLPNYQLNRVKEEGGLKTADVVSMSKDDKGFLWIATQSSVYRFDGKHTARFSFAETISKVFIDKQSRKWVQTRSGVYLFNDSLNRFNPVNFRGLGGSALLFETAQGLFALVKGECFQFQERAFKPTSLPFIPHLQNAHLYFGRLDSTLFFGNNDSVFSVNLKTKLVHKARTENIYQVVPISDSEVIVSSSRYQTYIVNLQDSKRRALPIANHFTNTSDLGFVVHDGIRVSDLEFLLSTNKGLIQYSTTKNITDKPVMYFDGRPLQNQSSISTLYQDSMGSLYLNHADGIFFKNAYSSFIQYLRNYSYGNSELADNNVRNFTEDDHGSIWMATTSGVSKLEIETGAVQTIYPVRNAAGVEYPSYRQVLCIGSQLWLGTSGNGVWCYDIKTGKSRRPLIGTLNKEQVEIFNKAYIWKLLKLQDGNLFVVSGNNFYIIDPVSMYTRIVPFPMQGAISRSALQDSDGRIWYGTNRGLACLDTSFRIIFTIQDSIPDQRIASLCEWQMNKMLIGSKGLFRAELSGNKLISFRQSNAIPAERFIYCMKQDKKGFVWLGTDEGMYRYDPAEDKATYFDESDHVQSQAFNSDAAFLSRNGTLFMGGKNGINYFKPAEFIPIENALQPFLLSFNIPIGYSTYQKTKKVPYNKNTVEFVISAPEFKQPFRVQYRYRLNENEDQWTHNGYNNQVRISQLQAGEYSLQVSASYDGLNWFDGEEVFSFQVLSPWWKQWWFRIVLVLILAVLVRQISIHRKKRKQILAMKQAVAYFSQDSPILSSVDALLWDITSHCISELGLEDCVIYLVDNQGGMLIQKAAYGAKSPAAFQIANPIEIPIGRGITGHAAQIQKAILVGDTSKDERYILDDQARLSELAVPIVHDGKLIGVIDSEHHRKNFFTQLHLETLQSIASLSASRIATAMAQEAEQKAKAELILLNSKITEAKFANLRLQMNPHFLFNILTTIQYLIISKQINKANHYLDTFAGFLRSLLDHAEDTVVTLQEELRILKLYVELESLCLDETFEWDITVCNNIDLDEVTVPFMLLQPFVENAINHGLIHKIGKKGFQISIQENNDDSLLCVIQDNGIGRSASAEMNRRNLSHVMHKSKGIEIVRERLELLGRKTGKQAFVQIEDLWVDDKPAGTLVKLLIPYYTNEEL